MNTTTYTKVDGSVVTVDARGYVVHPERPTCPNCKAFNVGRRCGCTRAAK